MKIENDIKLDFNDVLLRPKRSTLSSRKEVDVEREFTFKYSKQIWKGVPIISSNMDTVSSIEMFKELAKNKILTCFHKFINIDDVILTCNENPGYSDYFVLSTGITDNDYVKIVEQYNRLKENGIVCKFICIDVANGYMFKLVDFSKKMRETFPDTTLIAGNVVSREITEELIINGRIDIVKVGIGSGAVCTTRLQTGVGMPQFSAVMECADAAHGLGGMIISDGGICNPGDLSKAYGGGADFVMLGSMLAGHVECPGEIKEDSEGNKFKLFYGMSSDTAMNKHHGGVASYRSSEGKTVKVPLKGNVQDTINNILGGVRSTCTYIGSERLKDISKCATFIRVNRLVNTFYK
jgi:GMP reductase